MTWFFIFGGPVLVLVFGLNIYQLGRRSGLRESNLGPMAIIDAQEKQIEKLREELDASHIRVFTMGRIAEGDAPVQRFYIVGGYSRGADGYVEGPILIGMSHEPLTVYAKDRLHALGNAGFTVYTESEWLAAHASPVQ